MGTRIERTTGANIAAEAVKLADQKVQVVTWSGQTYMGRLRQADQEHLVLEDLNAFWYNRRRHTHKIPIQEVRELSWDKVAAW